ncbi:cyclic pyranopterin monophosphate synthase MoaC, partial [Xanthomonas perforans]|nr:cyclic pyranopterin monophosphate synthase MoaC [Xanthomonas perforans]
MPANSRSARLTHLDDAGLPTMVDVSDKAVTARSATAESRVRFPAAVTAQLRANGLRSAKGG